MAEHRSTARVLDIFDFLATSPEGYTLTELSELLNAPKSSIMPIIHTMANRSYVSLDHKTNKYSIGINTFSAGAVYNEKLNMTKFIKTEMERVTSWCQETCVLSKLCDENVLYIHKIDAPEKVMLDTKIGGTKLACTCAMGKVLLCDLRLGELKSLYPNPIPKTTTYTQTDLSKLHLQMEEIRLTSMAYDKEESERGMHSIASPIRYDGKIVAALGIMFPTFRITEEKVYDGERVLRIVVSRIESVLKNTEANIDNVFSLDSYKV